MFGFLRRKPRMTREEALEQQNDAIAVLVHVTNRLIALEPDRPAPLLQITQLTEATRQMIEAKQEMMRADSE